MKRSCFATLIFLWITFFDCWINHFHYQEARTAYFTNQISLRILCSNYLLCKSFWKIYPEITAINNDRPTEFQKMFEIIKQIEEFLEPYQTNNSDLSDFHGYHAAYLSCKICNWAWKQCQTLQVNCNSL